MRKYILFVLLAFLYACGELPEETHYPYQKIEIGNGPEDVVLDKDTSYTRILAGCQARRPDEKNGGNIYYIDIESQKTGILKRSGEPDGFLFHPHGMDLIQIDTMKYLYVINHLDEINKHPVVKYEVHTDELVYVTEFNSDLYVSPNDLCVYKDGGFWITNDAGKRNSMTERILKLKRASVVFTDINGNAKIVADKLAYANGITYKEDKLYVSTTMQNTVFEYDIDKGNLSNRRMLCEVKGGDNLTWYGNQLIIAAHLDFMAFMKHVKDSTAYSPSVIYEIDPDNGNKKVIYSNGGDEISAASTAIRTENELYISQVFDPHLLKVRIH